jgi:hypothetical protein
MKDGSSGKTAFLSTRRSQNIDTDTHDSIQHHAAAAAHHMCDIPVPLFKARQSASLMSKAVNLRITPHNAWGARLHTEEMILLLLPLNLMRRIKLTR